MYILVFMFLFSERKSSTIRARTRTQTCDKNAQSNITLTNSHSILFLPQSLTHVRHKRFAYLSPFGPGTALGVLVWSNYAACGELDSPQQSGRRHQTQPVSGWFCFYPSVVNIIIHTAAEGTSLRSRSGEGFIFSRFACSSTSFSPFRFQSPSPKRNGFVCSSEGEWMTATGDTSTSGRWKTE